MTGVHIYRDSGVNIGGSPTAQSGTFPISVLVHDEAGSVLLMNNSATVADVAIRLGGRLNPASDSGLSPSDAITNVSQPSFFGTSEPFSQVSLYAQPVSGGPSVLVGQTEADSTGAWTITTDLLADGSYVITAMAIDQFHDDDRHDPDPPQRHAGPADDRHGRADGYGREIRPQARPDLRHLPGQPVGDGPGPGEPGGQLRPDQAAPAARDLPGQRHRRRPAAQPGPETVVLSINPSRQLRGGIDTFTILSGAGATGIRDVAGNALDGEFSGSFPSGNQIPGGNFVAELDAVHHLILAPQT